MASEPIQVDPDKVDVAPEEPAVAPPVVVEDRLWLDNVKSIASVAVISWGVIVAMMKFASTGDLTSLFILIRSDDGLTAISVIGGFGLLVYRQLKRRQGLKGFITLALTLPDEQALLKSQLKKGVDSISPDSRARSDSERSGPADAPVLHRAPPSRPTR